MAHRSHILFPFLVIACFFVVAASILNIVHVLNKLGVESIFEEINLGTDAKIFISLYLTLVSISFSLLVFGLFYRWKGETRNVGLLAAFGSIFQVGSLVSANILSFDLSIVGILFTGFGIIFSLIVSILSLSIPSPRIPKEPLMSPFEIAISSIFSALTAVIIIITGSLVPSPTGGYTHIGDMIIFLAALLFGRKIGGITGIIGSIVADFWLAYPRWYVSIPAHGLQGIIAGFGKNKSTTIQVILCGFAGFVMASTYFYVNIFIKGYPLAIISYARDLFGQAGISMILAITISKSVQKVRLVRQ